VKLPVDIVSVAVFLFVVVAPYWYIKGGHIASAGPVLNAPPDPSWYDCTLFVALMMPPSASETVATFFAERTRTPLRSNGGRQSGIAGAQTLDTNSRRGGSKARRGRLVPCGSSSLTSASNS
jgi:hypothetical protein